MEGFKPSAEEIAGFQSARAKNERKATAEAGRRRNELTAKQSEAMSPDAIAKRTAELSGKSYFNEGRTPAQVTEAVRGSVQNKFRKERDNTTQMSVLHEQALAENEKRITEARAKIEEIAKGQADKTNASVIGKIKRTFGGKDTTAMDETHKMALKKNEEFDKKKKTK